MTDYDRMIRERYNALALRCDELTKENERLNRQAMLRPTVASQCDSVHQKLEAAEREIERLKEVNASLEKGKARRDQQVMHAVSMAADAREELFSLRKDREAWDAVREHKMSIDYFSAVMTGDHWDVSAGISTMTYQPDPRDAALALKEQLESE